MPLSFPASPTVGDTYTVGTRTWTWDGTIWSMQAATLGVASISTAEIADGAVTTEKIASGAVVEADIASNAVTAGKIGTDVQLGYRNVVINGAMQVAQRGTSVASLAGGGYFTADRWTISNSNLGTWTQSVENDAPTGSGFRKSLKMLCTTADASPASGDEVAISQLIEGQNLQQFCKGTSSAKQFVLSFWVKANVTGTYIVWLYDPDNSRETSLSYQVSSSATWEKKTLVFAADTTGAFDNDNAVSLYVRFYLGAGSSFTSGSLSTTWTTQVNANRAVGQVNLAAATNNYWQVTGVQLEAGSVATPFEFEDYGTTLRKCYRYYWRKVNYSVASGTQSGYDNKVHFPLSSFNTVEMRATPTAAFESTPYIADYNSNLRTITAVSMNGSNVVAYTYDSTKLTTGLSLATNFSDPGRAQSFSAEL